MNTSFKLLLAVILVVLAACGGADQTGDASDTQEQESSPPEPPQPDDQSTVVCTADVFECEDGTFVSRKGPDCDFSPCPVEEITEEAIPSEPEPAEEEPETLPGPDNEEVDHNGDRGLGVFVNDTYIVQKDGADMLQDLICDLETDVLTVTLAVPAGGKESYSLKRGSLLSMPDDVALTRLSLNGRQIKELETFCGGIERLAPGEKTTCELAFTENDIKQGVMVRTGLDEFDKPMSNRLHLSSAYLQSEIEFICK